MKENSVGLGHASVVGAHSPTESVEVPVGNGGEVLVALNEPDAPVESSTEIEEQLKRPVPSPVSVDAVVSPVAIEFRDTKEIVADAGGAVEFNETLGVSTTILILPGELGADSTIRLEFTTRFLTVEVEPIDSGTVSTRVVLALGVSTAVVRFDEGVAHPLEAVEFAVLVRLMEPKRSPVNVGAVMGPVAVELTDAGRITPDAPVELMKPVPDAVEKLPTPLVEKRPVGVGTGSRRFNDSCICQDAFTGRLSSILGCTSSDCAAKWSTMPSSPDEDAYTVSVTSETTVAGARLSQSLQKLPTLLSGLLLSKAANWSLGQSRIWSCLFSRMFFHQLFCASSATIFFTSTCSSALRCRTQLSVVAEKERRVVEASTERVRNMIEHSSE
ncbi:hypothetical protein BU25DRAFT_155828 [Macroventuria anomochaeta]|uniref:Uncharacterized protein n=1 Tax=Macroventuria anomochaeta TaxID=301207 RepID=A0ACB6RTH9_9PLEO|nr:uncharacterized protein BU25DRAFT_155828 [Macroventuria anomochaeta]KAF2624582.1 hypothetical protein BU25DRAFT_155828 [Macroventuria anomochaeta]